MPFNASSRSSNAGKLLSAALMALATVTATTAPQLNAAEYQTQGRHIGLRLNISQSPFIGSDDSHIKVSPTSLSRDGFYFNGPTLPFYSTPNARLFIGVGLDELDYERGDSPELQDMDELDRAINIRLGGAIKGGNGITSLEFARDVADAHESWQGKLRYTHLMAMEQARLRPYAELQWLSGEVADYYVGVNNNEVSTDRAAYEADDSFIIKAGLDYERPLTENITFVGGIYVNHYDEQVSDSPIIDEDLIWGGHAGLTYRWK